MNILITGSCGFIGYHLCQSLLKKGHAVIGVDNLNSYYDVSLKNARLNALIANLEFSFINCDISDFQKVKEIFSSQNIELVINLAAQAGVRYSITNPDAYFDSNVLGFFNILKCIKNFGVKNFIYASSSSVYGSNKKIPFSEDDAILRPESFYASTKISNEAMAASYSKLFDFSAIGLRFFTVYGPLGRPDMSPWIFSKAILDGEEIKLFNNGLQKRDFTFIQDIVSGIELAISWQIDNNKKGHTLFNLGNSQPISIIDYLQKLELIFNKKAQIRLLDSEPGDVDITFANISKSQNELCYSPRISLDEGLKIWAEWFLSWKK